MTELRTVAALFVDRLGPYPKLEGVDCWDLARDASKYPGPHPVVAHPPCGSWSSLKHQYKGGDRGLATFAAETVRKFGGVLEHPATSKLFEYWGLPTPWDATDHHDGRTYELDQCDWGHVARKTTWIYVVGVDQRRVMDAIRRKRGTGVVTHWCSGGRRRTSGSGGLVPPGIKVCSTQQRNRTPRALAEWLVSLARSSQITRPA